MKMAIETLGCRVNIYDSEAVTGLFRQDGYAVVDFTEPADVYVINTCTVTHMGDKKSRQLISRARRLNPDAVIAVVGCYSQVAPEEIAALEGVDIVLGSRNKSRVVELANRSLVTGERFIEVTDVLTSHEFEALDVTDFADRTRAFLKIQDGCNRFCTYCMIPYARGGLSSKPRDQILTEIRQLVDRGFREVILSGIHIASYGLEAPPREDSLLLDRKSYDLLDLLEEIETIPGLERVRIGSIEPMFFQGDRLERIRRLTRLCPHFHLSLQSGCDTVLRRMNRRYTTREYQAVVQALRQSIPGVSITTDLIAGFPGETESEHRLTLAFLEGLALTRTHVFKYSPREGTPAAAMADQVPAAIKDRRSHELLELSDQMERRFHQAMVGAVHPVLFEVAETSGSARGLTTTYVDVIVAADRDLAGEIHSVRITAADTHRCRGELV